MEQQMPTNVVFSFVGPISYPATKNLRSVFCNANNNGAKTVILLLSSTGGSTEEGFSLYHLLRSLPFELITYNIGTVASIANIVFLAGSKRFACENSRFVFHDFSSSFQQENLDRDHINERSQTLDFDAMNFKEICKRHTSLTDRNFKSLQLLNKPNFITPARAKEMGIIQEITDAKFPFGVPTINIEW